MSYHEELKKRYILRLRDMEDDLPDFTKEFFVALSEMTSIKTRVGYAYDLKIFFDFLLKEHTYFKNLSLEQIKVSDLERVTPEDIEIYLNYLTLYTMTDEEGNFIEHTNEERGKSRKLAAVRRMYSHFYRRKKISANPAMLVDTPKMPDKSIIRLEVDEVARLLDEVESGEHLTERQKKWHALTHVRDLAIITLLLGTGIRLSECVGIDLDHIDFNSNGIKITRKGGNETIVYFGQEVAEALNGYLTQRDKFCPKEGHEKALFLSLQSKRLTDRAIQNLVKKYSSLIVGLKNISPHKLRSTYGTTLYRETGDIYLVADALGHKDVNTTKKHYAEIDNDRRKTAAKYIKLRED